MEGRSSHPSETYAFDLTSWFPGWDLAAGFRACLDATQHPPEHGEVAELH
jgi:hypothetical protein